VNDVRHFALNLLFAQYWGLEDGMSFNGPAWSISAEIPVYMLFFMGCALTGPRSRFRLPLALGMFLALALIGFRFFHHSAVLIAADYFYIGVLSCHLYAAVREMPRPMRIVTTSTIWIVACGSAFLVGWGLMDMETSTLIMFPAFVLAFQLTVPDGNPRGNRCVMFLGDMTYASYLLQFPLQLAIVLLAGWAGLKIEVLCGTHAFLLGYVLIVCTTSRLVFQVFEVPAQNWLRRALLGRPAGAGPVRLASSLGG
jgi:peptidoglycan/LPS O-acetylase OafA/YrhL